MMFYSVCKNKQLFRKLQIISHKFVGLTLNMEEIRISFLVFVKAFVTHT